MTTILGTTHKAPAFQPPAGSCDCHTHVFGPASRFPYNPDRTYTPPDASIDDLLALHRHLGIDRVVIVHPSPYGIDNRCSTTAIQQIGLSRARGVAVIGAETTNSELNALDIAGMRGARANLETTGVFDPNAAWVQLEATARRVAPLGWHLQTFARLSVIAALGHRLATLPVPLVIDHFGKADASQGLGQPGFDMLRRLVGSGKAYIKLSAAYRISSAPDFTDAAPLARALITDNPDRILWGTDWPHPGGSARARDQLNVPEPFFAIDDGAALNRLALWVPNAACLKQILVDNPKRLYGF